MREIEFRAWLKDENKMVKVKAIDWVEEIDIFSINYPEGKSYSGYDRDNIELMQYIGLKDKNGVKIFEGDIVRFEVDDICTKPLYIDYDKHDCSFSLFRKGIVDRGLLAHYHKDIVVIGNIYENKELLNG